MLAGLFRAVHFNLPYDFTTASNEPALKTYTRGVSVVSLAVSNAFNSFIDISEILLCISRFLYVSSF